MKNCFSALLLIFCCSLPLFAQENAAISFNETTFNFGNIREVDGAVEHEFIFTNTGNAPLTITSVNASCGCTTPGWSADSIMPGENGFIKASFDPFNRPGTFNKTLTVNTNGEPNISVLTIEGYVYPKPKSVENDLPATFGNLRFKYKAFNVGKVITKEPVLKGFEVYNESDSGIFIAEKHMPNFIDLKFEPDTLLPRQRGLVWLSYDAKAKNDFGFVSDNVTFITNEKRDSLKSFSVFATIEEYFPPVSASELGSVPKLIFNGIAHDFGTVKKGDVLTVEFPFVNAGGSALNIRKTKANCGCTVSNLAKSDLVPGESGSLTVRFNTAGREGTQQKSITVFSNDPLNPTQVLTIKALVR